jgi:hypothetical protein
MIKAAIVLCASTASAAPITGMFGAGEQISGGGGYGGSHHGLAIDAAIAYVVADGIALGVRGSIATASSYSGETNYELGYPEDTVYSVVPLDLGITAIFTHKHWWFAPWFGEHVSLSTNSYGDSITTADFAMIGLTGGVDFHDGLAAFVDVEHNLGGPALDQSPDETNPVFQSWIAMTVGIADHF